MRPAGAGRPPATGEEMSSNDATPPRGEAPASPSDGFDAARVRVLGLGNVLMGDDGAGPWIVEELIARWTFPEGVAVADLGTPGLDLIPFLAGAETLVLVDTVKSDGPPGTLRLYRKDEILLHPPGPRVSPHDPGVKEALLTLELAGGAPSEVVLVGVVPGSVAKSVCLTPEVRDAVGKAAAEVVRLLGEMGLPPAPRPEPLPVEPWWTRSS